MNTKARLSLEEHHTSLGDDKKPHDRINTQGSPTIVQNEEAYEHKSMKAPTIVCGEEKLCTSMEIKARKSSTPMEI